MISVPYYDKDGNPGSAIEVDEAVFGSIVKKRLLREAVLMYAASRRSGTACTKTRAQVAGTGKKPFRQKGTGRARQGSSNASPHHRKGGVAWGPKPRDYSYSIPKKARRQALRTAILSKLVDNQAVIIESLEAEKPATRKMAKLFEKMGIEGSCLVGLGKGDENVYKSIRNLEKVDVDEARNFNAYNVLRRNTLLLTKDAFEMLKEAAK